MGEGMSTSLGEASLESIAGGVSPIRGGFVSGREATRVMQLCGGWARRVGDCVYGRRTHAPWRVATVDKCAVNTTEHRPHSADICRWFG